MTDKTELARQAVRQAMRLRARLGVEPTWSVCSLDLAIKMGLVVRLHALPSLEGMYSPGRKAVVLLGTDRPWGRIRHTCGHEVGHHMFGHGASVDEFDGGGQRLWKPEEFMADRFATGLLMPKLAVTAAIKQRGWNAAKLSPEQAFVLAQAFGVGYTNFVSHLERTLKVVDPHTADWLRHSGKNLQRLRNAVGGFDIINDVFVVDEHWGARPVDIEIGDVAVVPEGALFIGRCVRFLRNPLPHIKGVAVGEGRLELQAGCPAVRVRVCRRGFTGLAKYRHMEDVDDE